MKTCTFNFNYKDGYEYIECPFDEKNLTTDWLTEFLFNNKAIEADERNVIAGFGNIPCQSDELVVLEWGNNVATWKFIERNYLGKQDVTDFCNDLREFLVENEDLAFTVSVKTYDGINMPEGGDYYDNQITITFNAKVEY